MLGLGVIKSNTNTAFCASPIICPTHLPVPFHHLHPVILHTPVFRFHPKHSTFVSSPCGTSAPPCCSRRAASPDADHDTHSGIFGYINYLVEKDRKYILDTLINGKFCPSAVAAVFAGPWWGPASSC